ncbi:hypothetical protein H5410_061775 [Solanum commersonii]|uniref:Uncharacterized protein n=1 Tax=Solanum commersonii TaxID=4109 RepID=A0A9J5W8X6_SOLCO|nr:hypothetical protein H5410_061775 [Solanum commersonii]
MWNKYCKKHHPIIPQGFGESHEWRKTVLIREAVENEIWALYYLEEEVVEENIEVKEFITERRWNRQLLLEKLSIEMTDHIMDNIKTPTT